MQKMPFKIQGFVRVLSTHIYVSFNDLKKTYLSSPIMGLFGNNETNNSSDPNWWEVNQLALIHMWPRI